MKLEVVRCDGRSEVLNIVGPAEFHEPYEENGVPVGQGAIYAPQMGMRYFFRADGRYDGWEAECGIPLSADDTAALQGGAGGLPQSLTDFIGQIEAGRDIRER